MTADTSRRKGHEYLHLLPWKRRGQRRDADWEEAAAAAGLHDDDAKDRNTWSDAGSRWNSTGTPTEYR